MKKKRDDYSLVRQKAERIMKITTLLLILGDIHVSATTTYAQSQRITISIENGTFYDVISQIEKQSEFMFFYNSDEIDNNRQISIQAKDKLVAEILNELIKNNDLTYKITGKHIIIFKAEKILQQTKRKVTGMITDPHGEPVIGVNVIEKGTKNGVITNVEGEFSISVENNATLQIRYIGYISQEIPVGNQTHLEVTMREDTQTLDEVVVVGYGVQKKVNLTGAVSSVNFGDQAESRPITNISTALAGLSSGVSILQGSGQPGEDKATIRIRGGTLNNSDLLVIIDGIEGDMNFLNPHDIESISLLKDAASASIYGSRAANGVILITTKKGNKERVNVHYSGSFSVASPTNLVKLVSDYPQYMRLMNESNRNIGSGDIFTQKTITAWEEANRNPNGVNALGIPNWVAYPNTDWQEEMYQNNIVQNHSISVDGGTEKTSFMLSLGYMDNPGLVENTGVKRYTLRANLNINVTDWLTVGTNTYATLQSRELGDYKSMNEMIGGTSPGVTGKYKGKYGFAESTEESSQTDNMYSFLNRYGGKEDSGRFNTNVFSKITFLKDFTWDFNLNYNRRFDEYDRHSNANERVRFSTGEVMSPATDPSLMTTTFKDYGNYSYTIENLLRYNKTFAQNHDVSILLGYNEYYYK